MNDILKKYTTILFDLDGTLLDFKKAEYHSLWSALEDIGVTPSNELINEYSEINEKYWRMVERKEITVNECLVLRFIEFFKLKGINYDADSFEDIYRSYLNNSYYKEKYCVRVLTELKKTHDLYIITNGVRKTNMGRMEMSNIKKYFKGFFVSETIGANKPAKEFYDAMIEGIKEKDKSKMVIIGDSLTSDIKLGNLNQIDTIWYNILNQKEREDIKPTYEIKSLKELI